MVTAVHAADTSTMEYTKEFVSGDYPLKEYIEKFVDVEQFLPYCEECPNYGRIWSCPPYDFNPMDIWKAYDTIHVEGTIIRFPEEETLIERTKEEIFEIEKDVCEKEKQLIADKLLAMEDEKSISLSAGTCLNCKSCTRPEGKPCVHPEIMRYSIESLGGNVGLTCSKLLGIELEWVTEGYLPKTLTLISALLIKD